MLSAPSLTGAATPRDSHGDLRLEHRFAARTSRSDSPRVAGGTLEKARPVGYLAGQARKAIETGTLAARLEMLEKVLEQREGEGR